MDSGGMSRFEGGRNPRCREHRDFAWALPALLPRASTGLVVFDDLNIPNKYLLSYSKHVKAARPMGHLEVSILVLIMS
jgi:hypothetical protein